MTRYMTRDRAAIAAAVAAPLAAAVILLPWPGAIQTSSALTASKVCNWMRSPDGSMTSSAQPR